MIKHKHTHRYYAISTALLFAVAGVLWLAQSLAATHAVGGETEQAALTGNAASALDAGASGGMAIRFGNLPLLPTEIRAITGGTSIALVWRASPSPDITGYEIYRDNARIATVRPGSGTVLMEKEGRRYIDTNVVRGQTYSYRLRTLGSNGAASVTSTAITARHPTATTPMPNLTFEYLRAPAPANKAFVETTIRNEMNIWYPKISDTLAYPDYTPGTNIIIETNPDILVGRAGNRIGYNPAQLTTDNMPDMLGGGLLHETVHLVTDYTDEPLPSWLTEGIADWTRDDLTLERTPAIIPPGALLSDLTYSTGAAYMRYISRTYRAGFARDINLAVRANQYSSSSVTNLVGKSEAQLLNELKALHAGVAGTVTGPGGKCMTVANNGTVDGTKLILNSCNGSNAQKWTTYYENIADKNPDHGGNLGLNNFSLGVSKCADVAGSGTVDNSNLHFWSCDFGKAQRWYSGPNSSLVNPNSGKCLAPQNGSTADGTQLVIMSCNGSATQRWSLPK